MVVTVAIAVAFSVNDCEDDNDSVLRPTTATRWNPNDENERIGRHFNNSSSNNRMKVSLKNYRILVVHGCGIIALE